jgi:hypothetical protein
MIVQTVFKFKKFDLTNCIHVFFKDSLWSTLPRECIEMIVHWVKMNEEMVPSTMFWPRYNPHEALSRVDWPVPSAHRDGPVKYANKWELPQAYVGESLSLQINDGEE